MKVTRTFDLVDHLMDGLQRDDALTVKKNGKWEKFSTKEYKEFVDNFSYGLLALGFKKGDKIVTISNNRPEWNFIDMGMTQIGAVHVPIYANLGPVEYDHILTHSDARIVIASYSEFYDKIKASAEEAKNVEKVYSIDPISGVPSWMEIIDLGKKNESKFKNKLVEIKENIDENELMSIIYTSGTTGLSKGVMLSHRNFMSNVHGTIDRLPVDSSGKFLSFLPLCHVFERMVNYLLHVRGVAVYYAESIETVGDNMKEVKPEGFAAVPRVVEKLFDKIMLKGKELKGIKKGLFFWAVSLGEKFDPQTNSGFYNWKLGIARKLIFSKWQEALGGKVEAIVSGGAALNPKLNLRLKRVSSYLLIFVSFYPFCFSDFLPCFNLVL